MSNTNLRSWANNFATLRRLAEAPDSAPAPFSQLFPDRWQGADRVFGPQFNALVPMMMPLVQAGLLAGGVAGLNSLPEAARLDGREDLLLFGRYFLELAALKAEQVDYATARTTLSMLSARLENVARAWEAGGVSRDVRAVLVEETRVAAERLRGHAPGQVA